MSYVSNALYRVPHSVVSVLRSIALVEFMKYSYLPIIVTRLGK
jgi:hypothetical protein